MLKYLITSTKVSYRIEIVTGTVSELGQVCNSLLD